jgi:hypothetical protein
MARSDLQTQVSLDKGDREREATMNELFIHKELFENELGKLEHRRKLGLQKEDTKLHDHKKGEQCGPHCLWWSHETGAHLPIDKRGSRR